MGNAKLKDDLPERAVGQGYLELSGTSMAAAMTSGAALSVVNDAARSNAPALGYTGTYAFANVILTVAGTLIMLV